jgi:hypothetical protein
MKLTSLERKPAKLPGTNVANVDTKIHTVRIGLNYRFGGYGYGTHRKGRRPQRSPPAARPPTR